MQQVGGITTALGAGVPLTAHATTGGSESLHADDLPDWFDRLDAHRALGSTYAAPPELAAWLEAKNLPPDLFEQGWATLLEASAFRDLPQRLQRDERVQERSVQTFERAGQAALALRDLLASATSEDWQKVGELARDPVRLEQVRQHIVADGETADVGGRRIEQVNALFEQMSWSFANLDAEQVALEHIKKVDDMEASASLHVDAMEEPEGEHFFQAGGSSLASINDCRTAMRRVDQAVWREPSQLEDALQSADVACETDDGRYRVHRYLTYGGRLGMRFLVVGALAFGGGVLCLASATVIDIMIVPGLGLMTVGGLLLIAGLFLFAIGLGTRMALPAYQPT